MREYIPFVRSEKDIELLHNTYTDARIVRISLENRKRIASLPPGTPRWIDPAVDVYHKWPPYRQKDKSTSPLETYFDQFDSKRNLSRAAFVSKPDRGYVRDFVVKILDECLKYSPDWLSIPQLPMDHKQNRNKLNRHLAESSSEWRKQSDYRGKLVLPVILTHQDQSHYKPKRTGIIDQAVSNIEKSGANGAWIVDSKLDDLTGTNVHGRKRFPDLIEFHAEFKERASQDIIIIAGPYWCLNLILWARDLVTFPAIGLGGGYRYYVPGGAQMRKALPKVALPALMRLSEVNAELKNWLSGLINADAELRRLSTNINVYSDHNASRNQIAQFYKAWLDRLEQSPSAGRALALYQELSEAYVFGKSIKDELPRSEKPARRPEQVAKQFMLNCL